MIRDAGAVHREQTPRCANGLHGGAAFRGYAMRGADFQAPVMYSGKPKGSDWACEDQIHGIRGIRS